MPVLTASSCEVLVVGAGPVGLTMALELERHGLASRIVDCEEVPSDKSKALVIWGRTLELLEPVEHLVADLQTEGVPAVAASIYGNGQRLVHLEFDRDDTAYPRPLMIPQCDTERVLTRHLADRGVAVERSVSLTDFTDDGQRVRAKLRHADGREEIVNCPWLLGCDGAHSTVRKGLGFVFSGECEPNDWMLADVHLEGPLAHDEVSIFWHVLGIVAFFPIGRDRFRIVADLGHASGSEKPADPTLAAVQATIHSRGLSHMRVYDPVWLSGFRIHERKVADYSRGRVFLAGDAAHIHSPAGGQGMNTGMQDVCNLAWKLALVHRGQGRTTLLDTYSLERSAIGEMVLRNASRLTQLATLRNPILQFVRNHVALLAGKLTAVQQRAVADLTELAVHYPESPLNGDDAGQSWDGTLHCGDRVPDANLLDWPARQPTRLLAQLAGTHHRLLIFPQSNDPEQLAALAHAARSLGGEFGEQVQAQLVMPAVATDGLTAIGFQAGGFRSVLIDVDSQVRQRFGIRGTAIALVRPDGYLGFRGHAESWLKLNEHLAGYLIPASK